MNYNIFISYSEKDIKFIERLMIILKKIKILNKDINVNIFWDKNINYGENIPVRILQEIKNSDLFLLVWSENSNYSSWIIQEAVIAFDNKIKTLPLLLDNIPLKGFIQNIKGVPLYKKGKYDIGKYIITQINKKITIENKKLESKNKKLIDWSLIGIGAFAYILSRDDNEEEK